MSVNEYAIKGTDGHVHDWTETSDPTAEMCRQCELIRQPGRAVEIVQSAEFSTLEDNGIYGSYSGLRTLYYWSDGIVTWKPERS